MKISAFENLFHAFYFCINCRTIMAQTVLCFPWEVLLADLIWTSGSCAVQETWWEPWKGTDALPGVMGRGRAVPVPEVPMSAEEPCTLCNIWNRIIDSQSLDSQDIVNCKTDCQSATSHSPLFGDPRVWNAAQTILELVFFSYFFSFCSHYQLLFDSSLFNTTQLLLLQLKCHLITSTLGLKFMNTDFCAASH